MMNVNEDIFLSIVLPTYNERYNVSPLIERILTSIDAKRYPYEILFIDDSTDDTPRIIEGKSLIYKNIHLLHRQPDQRTGLATAFTTGFKLARGKYICCMDSDLQHPPEKILDMLDVITTNGVADAEIDIVVGTRYSLGGSASGLGSIFNIQGLYRRIVSTGMKYFTQIIFIPTRVTSDPLGGFFLFRRDIIYNKRLEPKGFKILVEILMRAEYKKVCDVPYHFSHRKNDSSKADLSQGWEFLKHLWHIFKTTPEANRFLIFCLVGISGLVINFGLLITFVELSCFSVEEAYVVASLISVFSNYFLNSIFTYKDKADPFYESSIRRVFNYYLISTVTLTLSLFVFQFFLEEGFHYVVAAFIGVVSSTILNAIIFMKFTRTSFSRGDKSSCRDIKIHEDLAN